MECSICLYLLTAVPPTTNDAKKNRKRKEMQKQSTLCCTPCGHIFHRRCLSSWLKSTYLQTKQRTCPYCRKKVSQENLYPVYLTSHESEQGSDESSEKSKLNATSGKRKSLLSTLRRIFSVSSQTQPEQGRPQQLQVAVTINCVSQTQQANEIVTDEESRLRTSSSTSTTITERNQGRQQCNCRCPHLTTPVRC